MLPQQLYSLNSCELIAATKFCRSDKDFYKNSPRHTRRIECSSNFSRRHVAATCQQPFAKHVTKLKGRKTQASNLLLAPMYETILRQLLFCFSFPASSASSLFSLSSFEILYPEIPTSLLTPWHPGFLRKSIQSSEVLLRNWGLPFKQLILFQYVARGYASHLLLPLHSKVAIMVVFFFSRYLESMFLTCSWLT